MAFSLAQGAQVRADPSYLARVHSSMVRHAATVIVEVQGGMTAEEYNARRAFAALVLRSPVAWTATFLSYLSADPGASLTWFTPVNVASSTAANPTVVTTATVHGLAVGDVVEIQGHAVNTNANGTWTVSAVGSTTTFTIPVPGNGAGTATGTAMEVESDVNVNFTIQSGWSRLAGHYVAGV